jgi:hypothetical protein
VRARSFRVAVQAPGAEELQLAPGIRVDGEAGVEADERVKPPGPHDKDRQAVGRHLDPGGGEQ